MKELTIKQAWLYLARQVKPRGRTGLCWILGGMGGMYNYSRRGPSISYKTFDRMSNVIEREVLVQQNENWRSAFAWPFTIEGNRQRKAFAAKQARLAK